MFGGRLKAIIDGKNRELEITVTQLESKTREVARLRDQLDRIIMLHLESCAVEKPAINRPTDGRTACGMG